MLVNHVKQKFDTCWNASSKNLYLIESAGNSHANVASVTLVKELEFYWLLLKTSLKFKSCNM